MLALGHDLLSQAITIGVRGLCRRAATASRSGRAFSNGVSSGCVPVGPASSSPWMRRTTWNGESSSQAYAVKIFITVDFVRFGEEPRTPAPPSAQTLDVSSAAVRALKAQLRAES